MNVPRLSDFIFPEGWAGLRGGRWAWAGVAGLLVPGWGGDLGSAAAPAAASAAPVFQTNGVAAGLPVMRDALAERLTFPLSWLAGSRTDFEAWRREARDKVMSSLLAAPPPAEFAPAVVAEEDRGTYVARIAAGVAVCWMTTVKSLMVPGNNQTRGQSAYSMTHPGLVRFLDYPDVASLACPKPMLFFNGERDSLFPLDGVREAHARLRRVWESQGAGDRLGTRVWDVPHVFDRAMQDAAFDWLDRQLNRSPAPPP